MKNHFLNWSIIFLLFMVNCQQHQEVDDRNLVFIEDGACYMESLRAKRDVDSGKLVFSAFDSQLPNQLNHKILREKLAHFNISFEYLSENCTADSNCYGKFMLTKISERYGEHFIDSLLLVACDSLIE